MNARVIVTGGRDYDDYETVAATLSEIRPTVVAEGGASGADRLAAIWCHETLTEHEAFPADWAKFGRAAGPIRNEAMLREFEPDLVVAFPGGRGTAHMVSIAREAGVDVLEVAR